MYFCPYSHHLSLDLIDCSLHRLSDIHFNLFQLATNFFEHFPQIVVISLQEIVLIPESLYIFEMAADYLEVLSEFVLHAAEIEQRSDSLEVHTLQVHIYFINMPYIVLHENSMERSPSLVDGCRHFGRLHPSLKVSMSRQFQYAIVYQYQLQESIYAEWQPQL